MKVWIAIAAMIAVTSATFLAADTPKFPQFQDAYGSFKFGDKHLEIAYSREHGQLLLLDSTHTPHHSTIFERYDDGEIHRFEIMLHLCQERVDPSYNLMFDDIDETSAFQFNYDGFNVFLVQEQHWWVKDGELVYMRAPGVMDEDDLTHGENFMPIDPDHAFKETTYDEDAFNHDVCDESILV